MIDVSQLTIIVMVLALVFVIYVKSKINKKKKISYLKKRFEHIVDELAALKGKDLDSVQNNATKLVDEGNHIQNTLKELDCNHSRQQINITNRTLPKQVKVRSDSKDSLSKLLNPTRQVRVFSFLEVP